MTQPERIHTGDLVIAAVVLAGQLSLARLLFTRWKRSLSPAALAAALLVLVPLWLLCAVGIVLTFLPRLHPAPVLGVMVSSVEILWGFLSAFALLTWLAAARLLRPLADTPPSAGRRKLIQGTAALVAAAPVAAIAYGAFIERTQFYVREIDLPVSGLHPDLENFRVAQLSDIHASPYLSIRHVARVVDMTNELKPNHVLITGDLITEIGDPLDATIAELARLRSDTGILGCLGNHEMYAECEDYATSQAARRGIQFLRSEARPLRWGGGALNIAGVDFQPFRHKERYLHGAQRLIDPAMPNILLSHNPDVFPLAVRQGFSAVIGGHTHGGQVTVEILKQTLNFARFFTPYVGGLYRIADRSCYVTAGIGTIGAPVRVGVPPEITLLRLRRA